MSKIDIKNFYKTAVAQKEFNSDFWNEVREISTEGELKVFIEEKVQPVAKKMGYNFSTKDLLNYEKQMAIRITEQQLDAVSGGVSAKNWALGGIFSLMALGAGIVGTTNSASAELTTQDVAKSTEVMRAIIDVNIQASKSRNGDWLYLVTDSNSTEALNLTRSMLDSFLKEAGFSSIFEIQAIRAKNAQGQILDIKLDKDLGKLFSESKEIPGKLLGTWGKANAKKVKATKSRSGGWLYLTANSDSTEALTLTHSMLESFLKEAGFSNVSEIKAIQAKNAQGQILDVKLDKELVKLFSESKEIPGALLGTWGKANVKKDISDVDADAEQTVAKTSGSGTEQSTIGPSDLVTAQTATKVDSEEVFETRQLLTDEQQLYAYEALNLQEAYALLKSGVVENVRFCGGINDIVVIENDDRRYSEDSGDAFTELLYMLYPSPAGTLNTNTGYKGKDSFAKYGGMSPELAAKFFAILNDCRNKKIEIPKEFKDITLNGERNKDKLSYINPEFKNALAWLKDKGLLTAEGFEKVKAVEDAIKRTEELKSNVDSMDINRLSFKRTCAERAKTLEQEKDKSNKTLENLRGRLKNDSVNEFAIRTNIRVMEEKLKVIGELEGLTERELEGVKRDLDEQIKSYKEILEELNSKAESIKNSEISNKAKFLMHFINTMKKAADLEVTDGSSYPEYFTERILMSYMCQTLNNSEDVRELYQKIAEQLSQNETNKAPIPEEEKETTAIKIAFKKEEIARLNDIINEAETQEKSAYKSETQSNGPTFEIGTIGEDGNVQIQKDTFSDCADITARHVINLLTFANEQNWDLILKDANMEDLNTKLREVVDAINSNKKVKFYDLKTRLQMFFLYQRGFIEGVDNEEDIEYRSKNGADDVTPLARTLWEYVICNMNEENLKNGLDKDKGLYPIVYVDGKNHEIETGYINMLKLMWNMAKALDLESEALESAKGKINALSERVKHDSTMFEKEDSTAFEEALRSIFSLFYTSGEIEFTLTDCKYAKINVNNEVKGNVTVNVIKGDQKLNFKIKHSDGHGEIKHNPVNFNVYKYLEKYCQNDEQMLNILKKLEYDQFISLSVEEKNSLRKIIMELNKCLDNDFEKLLLRSFINDPFIQERITPPVGFYGTFSEEELTLGDAFRNTALYEKYKALSAYETLQDEENNVTKINKVLDVDTMRGAKKIVLKRLLKGEDGKQQVTEESLSDVFYREFLKPHETNGNKYHSIYNSIYFHNFGEVEETYFDKEGKKENVIFDIIKTSEEGKVLLIVKSIPENGELIIPSSVYDKDKKEYKITYIDERSNTNYATFEGLKTLKFAGDFDKLEIPRRAFTVARTLQTVEINGNIKKLTIKPNSFTGSGIKTFTIKGNVESLNIKNVAFGICLGLENVTIDGDVRNLTIEKDAFCDCDALKIFTIQGNVGNLIMENGVFDSCENLKNKIPEIFKDKNKIIFYDTTYDGILLLKVNEAVSEISLDKETLETLGGNFQILQAKNLNEEIVEIIFDDDLKDEFLKIEDATGLHYERKRA